MLNRQSAMAFPLPEICLVFAGSVFQSAIYKNDKQDQLYPLPQPLPENCNTVSKQYACTFAPVVLSQSLQQIWIQRLRRQ